MSDVVWICQDWDRRFLRDQNFNETKHLLRGWKHTGHCGLYELVRIEEPEFQGETA